MPHKELFKGTWHTSRCGPTDRETPWEKKISNEDLLFVEQDRRGRWRFGFFRQEDHMRLTGPGSCESAEEAKWKAERYYFKKMTGEWPE